MRIRRYVRSFFPIGDLHIESVRQSKAFATYLNRREERCIVLLGDVVHFANSIWSSSLKEPSQTIFLRNLEKDVSMWEDFLQRLRVPTIYYLGTHEQFALRILEKLLPSRKLDVDNDALLIPRNSEIVQLGSRLFVTGLHIPDNIHPDVKSKEFLARKKKIEEWITKKTNKCDIPEPRRTILCTHDPCDIFYRNMGYKGLTKMLQKWPFKVHYHAHIHSNIRRTTIGKTQSVNRSFVSLGRLNPDALEPRTNEIRSLCRRDI